MKKLVQTTHDTSMTVIRIILGVVIFGHGAQKLFGWFGGHGVSETISMWKQWFGMPSIITFLVILGESLGAIALIIGLFGRFMAASIGLIMLGAVFLVHLRWGFYMNWYSQPNTGEGFEYHLLVLAMVVAILIKGSGAYSIDQKLQDKWR
ncbi:MAG: DoxX family protein [Ekhidna sp.]